MENRTEQGRVIEVDTTYGSCLPPAEIEIPHKESAAAASAEEIASLPQWIDEAGNVWRYRTLAFASDQQAGAVDNNAQPNPCNICAITIEQDDGHIIVPSTINGHEVIAIETQACALQPRLSSVTLPPTVKTIGKKAFAYNDKLEQVTFSEGLVTIGDFAFLDTAVSVIETPSTLRHIGDKAFYRCLRLDRVHLNEGLLTIGEEAFSHTALEVLRIPSTVNEIGFKVIQQADLDAPARVSVHPDNPDFVSDSEGFALYQRLPERGGKLLLRNYMGAQPYYSVLPGTVAIGHHAFAFCRPLQEVELPEGLEYIGVSAFNGCEGIDHIDLPSTLKTIGARAFSKTRLRSIRLPKDLQELADSALLMHDTSIVLVPSAPGSLIVELDPNNEHFSIKGGVLCQRLDDGTYKAIIYAGTDSEVSITSDISALGDYVFHGAAGIEQLNIHDGITGFRPTSFAARVPIPRVHLDLAQPLEGRTCVDFTFAADSSARHGYLRAFRYGWFNVKEMIRESDAGIMFMGNTFDMGRIAVRRLADPFLLDPVRGKTLSEIVEHNLESICKAFAHHRYNEGFSHLADLGYLTADNFADVLGWVQDKDSVYTTSYLLEMKRTRFGISFLSEYDL